ncbi:MAG TPA: hypothetical protein VJZ76_15880 [Thermoanaerobaculia bacterium]|nr:hypothetical protein [Thermoanaerobaculia bacterium]
MEPATALLVDHDPTAVDVLRTALAGESFAFDVAYDFATAIRCLDSGRYCGVIVDLSLPRGLELLGRTSLPTVVIANGSIPTSLREHIKFVLPKPVKTSLLLNVIRGLCSLGSVKEASQPRREARRAAASDDTDRVRA